MAPMINISDEDFERASQVLKLANIGYTLPNPSDKLEFFDVPSIGLNVSRQRALLEKNWDEAHELLADQGKRMLTIPEFAEVLKYARENEPDVYEDITVVRSPWRAEWLDAFYDLRKDGMYVLTGNRTKAEKLDEDTLMEDRNISLEDWVNNHVTRQGLPTQETKSGDLVYSAPRNGAIVRFIASDDLADFGYCYWDPSNWCSNLGVRAVKSA